MRYHVGQIIYAVLHTKGQVYPMLIVEEITKKTLKGEEVNYVLQAGSDASSTVLLSQVEGEVFLTPNEAKTSLISRASTQIEKLIMNSVKKAEEWYANPSVEKTVHELPQSFQEEEDESTVTLPDGTVARLKAANIA